MGAQIKACKQTNILQTSNSRPQMQRKRFRLPNQDSKLNFCSSTGCIPIQSNDHYLKFMQNRPKLNGQTKNIHSPNVSSDTLNPKIRKSRVQFGIKKRKIDVNADIIRQREALGHMLAEKLGLQPSKDMPLTSDERQNKQRLSEIVYKICINNQQRLIDIIDQIQTSFRGSQTKSESSNPYDSKLQKFLDSVSKTELDFLDMLYHNDQELYQTRISKLKFKRNIMENIVDIKQLMMEQKQFAGSAHLSYERFKSQGLQMIRKQKVCFFILAGGKSSRFQISTAQNPNLSYQTSNPQSLRESLKVNIEKASQNSKDFQPLNIPSERSMLELIIHRLVALGQLLNCHITIYLGISPDKITNLKNLFQNILIDQKKITIYPFAQKVLGALDFQGNLVVEDHGQASLWPVGTGDLWNIMRGDKQLAFPNANQLIQQGFQYIQVCGTSNVLEKCFDCFSLGLASEYDLDWTTKITESYSKRHSKSLRNLQSSQIQNVQPKIFINNQQQIYVCDPQQTDNYPQDCRYTFMNNSLFKLSYLVNALQTPELQNLWPRKKVHLTNNTPPFSKYRKVYSYEKDYTDIFRLATVNPPLPFDSCSGTSGLSRVQSNATKWRLILCDQIDYYPLIYKNGPHSDIECASKALTDLHRMYLGLDKCLGRVEIDPYVSLQGERLEELKRQLKDQTLSQDWIFIQKN